VNDFTPLRPFTDHHITAYTTFFKHLFEATPANILCFVLIKAVPYYENITQLLVNVVLKAF